MRLQKIEISQFGKLQNLNLVLSPEGNIIFGGNESGKSTLVAFIVACLYGLPKRNDRSISKSDRSRYRPWQAHGIMGGALEFEQQNKHYRLEAQFGATPAQDKIRLIDRDTNEAIGLEGKQTVAEYLLGMSQVTFERANLVRQLQVQIANDNKKENSEVLTALGNLAAVGESDVSEEAIQMSLKENLNQLSSPRRQNAIIPGLSKQIASKKEEYLQAETNEQVANSRQQELLSLEAELKELDQTVKALGEYKAQLIHCKELNQVNKLAEAISEKQREYVKQKEALAQLDNLLPSQELDKFRNTNNSLCLIVTQLDNDLAKETTLFSQLQHYKAETRELENQLAKKESVADLATELTTRNNDLKHQQENKYRIEQAKERLFSQKEELLIKKQELQAQVTKTEAKPKGKQKILLALIPIVLGLGLIGVSRFLFSSLLVDSVYIWLGTAVGLIISFCGLGLGLLGLRKQTNSERLKEQVLKEALRQNEQQMLTNNQAIADNKVKLKQLESELERSREKLENLRSGYEKVQLLTQKEQLLVQELKSKQGEYQELVQYIKSNLEHLASHVQSITVFIKDRSELDRNKLGIKLVTELEQEAEEIQQLTKLAEGQQIRTTQINSCLNKLASSSQSFDELLQDFSKQRFELEASVQQTTESLQLLGEQLNELQTEDAHISDELKKLSKVELEQRLAEITAELADNKAHLQEKELEFAEESTRFAERYQGKKTPVEIAREIDDLELKLKEATRYQRALELAQATFTEVFAEIQSRFAPELQQQASAYLTQMTQGKYARVLVDKTLALQIRETGSAQTYSSDYLSGGANDQIYLALRLALCDQLDGAKEAPLILDDIFVQYDDRRLKEALQLLAPREQQILLFTCQKHVVDQAEKDVPRLQILELPNNKI